MINRFNKRFQISMLAGLLAMTVAVTGCSKQGGGLSVGGNEKVATVDGKVITKAEYDKAYNEFKKVFSFDKLQPQEQTMLGDTIKQMTLNKLIYETMLNSEADKAGIKITDADVQQYKQEKIFSNPTLKEQYHQFLTQKGMSEADFDAALKDSLLQNKFVEVKGGNEVAVKDTEVQSFYSQHPDQFKVPERIQASHILVKAIVPEMKRELHEKNPKITDAEVDKSVTAKEQELKTKADKLYDQVKSNPNQFADVAKANSDDTVSARQGGELGPMMENNIDPVFWSAIEKTPAGKLYPGVLHTQFGYHIIKVEAHQAPHKEDFKEAGPLIKDYLTQQKRQAFLQKWAEQKKSTAKIVIEPAYMPKAAANMPGGQVAPAAGMAAPQGASAAPEAAPAATASSPAPAGGHQ